MFLFCLAIFSWVDHSMSHTMSVNDNNKLDYETTKKSVSVEDESVVSPVASGEEKNKSKWQNFKDSFKPAEVVATEDVRVTGVGAAASPLHKRLSNRHVQMIALGGCIGSGLFIGSGKAIATGGPAGVLIAFSSVSCMIFCMVMSLCELVVAFPVSGGYLTYITRFVDRSLGFAINLNYAMFFLIVTPVEIIAASITLGFWNVDKKYRDAFVALFYVVMVGINFFGVKGYGESEVVFSMIKVLAIIGFIILGIILVCGGGPEHDYIGGKYWKNPGPFVGNSAGQRLKAISSVFVTAAFSFGTTEAVGLVAAETKNPKKSIKAASKQIFWRISLFYILSLVVVGLLVPYNDPKLLRSTGDASASPFVLAIEAQGIKVLPTIMNVIIMLAAVSVGNSAIYVASRSLTSLAETGIIPKTFAYVDRKGRPLYSLIFASAVSLLSFLAQSDKQQEIFDWLMAICGLALLFVWAGIFASHICFRRALKVQGGNPNNLAFKSPTGLWGSWFGLVLIIVIFFVQFWIAIFPAGKPGSAKSFFESCLGFVVVFVMYFGHKIWTRNWKLWLNPFEVDITSGRRHTDLEQLRLEEMEEKEKLAAKPLWFKVYKFFC